MESVPEILSETEQSILNISVVSITTFPPDNNSSEEPAGIETSLIKKAVPLVTLISLCHQLIISVLLGENWVPYSNLFSIFGFLIISAATLQQSIRILLVFGHTRNIFLYELSSFIIIYSTLFWFGIEDIIAFSQIRVGLEALLTLTLFVYVVVKFTGIINLGRILYAAVPLIIGCGISAMLAQEALNVFENDFFNLLFVCSVFYTSLALILATLSFSIFRKTVEWSYINQIIINMFSSGKTFLIRHFNK